jgi:hypothetical protein
VKFGTYDENLAYKTVDENLMIHNATVMLYWGLATFTVGLMMQAFWLLPYMHALFVINFMIGLFINLDYAPSMLIAKLLHKDETKKPIGAVQKKFAWYLGFFMSSLTLYVSLLLQSNPELFLLLCSLCVICNSMLYFEVFFNVCVGCQLYKVTKNLGIMKQTTVQPKCMGNRCET